MIISYPILSRLASNCCSSLLLKTTMRSSHLQIFLKTGVLEDFAIFTGKHLCWNNFMKKTPIQVFFFEYCKIFKTSFFYRAPLVAASGHLHYFLILLFLTFSISLFRSSHWKCSTKKLFLKILQYS